MGRLPLIALGVVLVVGAALGGFALGVDRESTQRDQVELSRNELGDELAELRQSRTTCTEAATIVYDGYAVLRAEAIGGALPDGQGDAAAIAVEDAFEANQECFGR
jgi:hypothetical protein